MVQIVQLDKYRSKDVVATLRDLLEAAEKGEIRGIAFVVKVAPGDNRAGLAGEYRRHPEKALQATFMLERHLAKSGPFADSM